MNDETIFVRCLTIRFPDVRIEAIRALRIFRSEWSELVLPALEYAYSSEPVKNIGKRLLRLMGNGGGKEREQQYIDISDIRIAPSRFDTCLMHTQIAGTYFRDLEGIQGQIEEGDMLYLVREADNKYDNQAIIVTTEDGFVVGYVPRAVNPMLASMMDEGKKLYAVLRSDKLKYGKPDIRIMLSTRLEQSGNVIQLPRS